MNNFPCNFGYVAFLVLKHGRKILRDSKKGVSLEDRFAHADNFAEDVINHFGLKVHVYGLQDLIAGPAIVCPSHTSMIDMPAIAYALPGRKYFAAKKELFGIPFFGKCLKEIGMPEIDRSNRVKAIRILDSAAEMIKRESVGRKKEKTAYLLIYPEGTRTRDSKHGLLPFKKGAFYVSLNSNLPIIPVSSFGGVDLMPAGKWTFPDKNQRDYYLMIHTPVYPQAFSCGSKQENVEEMIQETRRKMEIGSAFLKNRFSFHK